MVQYSDRIGRLGAEGAFEVLARAKELEAQGKSIIHLEIGEPDFDTPKNISEAGIGAIRAGETHYGPSGGMPETRKIVAEYVSKTRQCKVTPENIVIMPGAKPLIFCGLATTINEGDEVIVPNPGYPTYESVVNFLGAKPVPMVLREEKGFRFLVDELKALITSKTRMIVINSPQNPTGGVLTAEDLETIYGLAEKHDLWVMTDEIYSRLVYDGKFESILSIPGALQRTIMIDGMSKTYSMTGWRLGYGAMPITLAEHMSKMAVNNFSCTATFAQTAMNEALTGPQDDVDKMVEQFRRRRDIIVKGLNEIDGVSCLMPKGAFYVFPNITGTGMTSAQVAKLLMDEAGIAGLAGTAFGKHGEGFVRFSYANSIENIEEALRRMKKVVEKALSKANA